MTELHEFRRVAGGTGVSGRGRHLAACFDPLVRSPRCDECLDAVDDPHSVASGAAHSPPPRWKRPTKTPDLTQVRGPSLCLHTRVGVTGRYLKQWEPDWLSKVIAKIEAAPPRRPRATGSSVVQPLRLDRRLSTETVTELVAAYEAGTSTTELCKCYGLSKGGVLKLLHEAGVEMRRQGLTEEQIEVAVRLREKGLGYGAIAQRIGKAKSSVREVIRTRHRDTTAGDAAVDGDS